MRKKYQFTVTVEDAGNKKSAELAILCAFARRRPDGMKFKLKAMSQPKKRVRLEIGKNGKGVLKFGNKIVGRQG